jgi:hypothetical protein
MEAEEIINFTKKMNINNMHCYHREFADLLKHRANVCHQPSDYRIGAAKWITFHGCEDYLTLRSLYAVLIFLKLEFHVFSISMAALNWIMPIPLEMISLLFVWESSIVSIASLWRHALHSYTWVSRIGFVIVQIHFCWNSC